MVFVNKVVFDTSALLSIIEKSISFDDVINDIKLEIGASKFYLTKSVIKELDAFAIKSIKKGKYVNIVKSAVKDFSIIEDDSFYADNSLVNLSKDSDYVFVTNDSVLIKSLKENNRRVFRLSNKNRFVMV